MRKKRRFMIVIQYLSNYSVKYCFYNSPITESLGGGWYEVIDYNLVCNASIFKGSLIPTIDPSELVDPHLSAYTKAKEAYEGSPIHKDKLRSFNQRLLNEKSKNCIS